MKQSIMEVVWEADLPLEMIEAAQSLHDQGPTLFEAEDLDVFDAVKELSGEMPEDAGLLDFLPNELAEEMIAEQSAALYESLLLSCAALCTGVGLPEVA